MNYSVTCRMHALRSNTCKQQKHVSGLFGTITRIQEPILVFWSTHDEGMCSLYLHVWENMEASQISDILPQLPLRRTKKKPQNPHIEAQQVSPSVSVHRARGLQEISSNLQLAQGCCLLLNDDLKGRIRSPRKWLTTGMPWPLPVAEYMGR